MMEEVKKTEKAGEVRSITVLKNSAINSMNGGTKFYFLAWLVMQYLAV